MRSPTAFASLPCHTSWNCSSTAASETKLKLPLGARWKPQPSPKEMALTAPLAAPRRMKCDVSFHGGASTTHDMTVRCAAAGGFCAGCSGAAPRVNGGTITDGALSCSCRRSRCRGWPKPVAAESRASASTTTAVWPCIPQNATGFLGGGLAGEFRCPLSVAARRGAGWKALL